MRPKVRGQVRRSTLIYIGLFVAALVLYFALRPDPGSGLLLVTHTGRVARMLARP